MLRLPTVLCGFLCCLCCTALTGDVSESEEEAPIPHEQLPDAQLDGLEVVKAWAAQRHAKGERSFSSTSLTRHPSPATWAGTVIYQIMPDRFNNGNASNDGLNVPSGQREQMARGDFSDMPNWRHGGDLQGIRDRLGYLADLGVQALWITPVLMHTGSYHGYCTTDLTTIDAGFGSPEELRALVAEAHGYGMAVVLDVVINHMCDDETAYSEAPGHETCVQSRGEQYWSGEQRNLRGSGGAAKMNFSSQFFPPFRTEAFFNRCGANQLEETAGLGPAAIFGDFAAGMFDYNTQNQDWQQIFTDLLKYWIAYADLDGFRLDAAKHVTTDFLAYFSSKVRAYARGLGKANFLIVGEVAASEDWAARALGWMMSNPKDPSEHGHVPKALTQRLLSLKDTYLADPEFPAPGLTSLYNFFQSGTAKSALRCQANSTSIEEYFASDPRKTLLAQSLPQGDAEPDAQLWTNVDLHDWPRFLGIWPQRTDLLQAAVAWLLTSPGAPLLYYGIEQGFNGNCPAEIDVPQEDGRLSIRDICDAGAHEGYGAHPDALKRQDMFMGGPWRLGSSIQAVDRTARIGNATGVVSEPWQRDAMLQRGHAMYQLTRKLAFLRRSCTALAKGRIVFHTAADASCGFLAFSRFLGAREAGASDGEAAGASDGEVVVLINPGGSTLRLEKLLLKGALRRAEGESFVNVLNTTERAQVRFLAGQPHLIFQDPVLDTTSKLFVAEGSLMPFNETLGIALCKN